MYRLTDFNDISTHLGLFYAKRLKDCINECFYLYFLLSLLFSFVYDYIKYFYLIQRIFQTCLTHRWDPNRYYLPIQARVDLGVMAMKV